MNSKLIPPLTYLGIFLIFSGAFYLLFANVLPLKTSTTSTDSGDQTAVPSSTTAKTGVISFSGPKNVACPINGAMYTEEEQKVWKNRRPMTIMIENHSDSRPQSGLNGADIVYEAVAEGGITRFMGVFYCGAVSNATTKYDVGPVRSARTYFLDLASEYADYPLYAHVGGANCSAPKDPVTGRQAGPCTTSKKALAIEQISDYGWNSPGTWGDLSQFALSYKACRREPERTGDVRATEHTMYCSTTEMWNVAADRGLTNETKVKKQSWDKNYRPWTFKQKDAAASTITTPKITFNFWEGYGEYSVTWNYDQATNQYLRSNGGKQHIDFNTKDVTNSKNIVIQYTKESRSIDIHGHNLYDMVGSGKGVLLQNGIKEDITWSKANRLSRTIFKDSKGTEVNFVPGKVWVEILPVGNKISYEGQS
ncbi:DUF3048 domain-containing protein [Candidatus Shapirobacteria bacterium]|nr:DUF3048 domain-containing protein [Candidatus Shapirobacteria bacterium]